MVIWQLSVGACGRKKDGNGLRGVQDGCPARMAGFSGAVPNGVILIIVC